MKLGVDIGGSHISVGIVSSKGEIIDKESQDIYIKEVEKKEIPNLIEDVIVDIIKIVLARNNLIQSDIEKIGITVPGTVDKKYIIQAKNLFLHQFNIVERLNKHLKNVPISLRNDAKCAAVAEKNYGNLTDYDDIVFLTIGTGIGGATFINGQLLQPKRFEGFEIGHMIICENGLECNCGKKGCFEKYASISAFKRIIAEKLNINHKISGIELKNIVINNLNDKNVEESINQYIKYLAIGISNLINIFEPEVICFGGSFVYYENIFMQRLKNELVNNNLIFNKTKGLPEFVMAKLENDAGIIGAVI